jgi:hypothetical protein
MATKDSYFVQWTGQPTATLSDLTFTPGQYIYSYIMNSLFYQSTVVNNAIVDFANSASVSTSGYSTTADMIISGIKKTIANGCLLSVSGADITFSMFNGLYSKTITVNDTENLATTSVFSVVDYNTSGADGKYNGSQSAVKIQLPASILNSEIPWTKITGKTSTWIQDTGVLGTAKNVNAITNLNVVGAASNSVVSSVSQGTVAYISNYDATSHTMTIGTKSVVTSAVQTYISLTTTPVVTSGDSVTITGHNNLS